MKGAYFAIVVLAAFCANVSEIIWDFDCVKCLINLFSQFPQSVCAQSCGHHVEVENHIQKKPCGCHNEKPQVFIQKQPPIIVDRKPHSVVVKAQEPIVVKPAPVIINRPGPVQVQPIVVKHQPKPLIVSKKVVKTVSPVIKKYYLEHREEVEHSPSCKDHHDHDHEDIIRAEPSHHQPIYVAPHKPCGCRDWDAGRVRGRNIVIIMQWRKPKCPK